MLVIVLVAVAVIGGLEFCVRFKRVSIHLAETERRSARPWSSISALLAALQGDVVSSSASASRSAASIGIILAAVITQLPFVEKIITPYILLLVTTPMIALVPLLMLKYGFASTPRIIAGGAGLGSDGDDQLRHRLSPHRPGQDRAGPLVWRPPYRSSLKSAFRWRCR